jgi:uncharacterized membrane protein YvbJ
MSTISCPACGACLGEDELECPFCGEEIDPPKTKEDAG